MASSSSCSSHSRIEITGDGKSDYKVKLQSAIRRNEWNNLKELLHKFPAAKTEPITEDGETVLILVAKRGKKSNFILRRLLKIIPRSDLTLPDCRGSTALHAAAVVGNVVGARLLVGSNPELVNIPNVDGDLPFHFAVTHVHRDLTLFLLKATEENVGPNGNPFTGQPGAKLMCSLISSGFYDVALELILKYPPTSAWDPDFSPLKVIAQEPTAFPSGVAKLGLWERMIYPYVDYSDVALQLKELFKKYPTSALEPTAFRSGVHLGLWELEIDTVHGGSISIVRVILDNIVPKLKNIRRIKASHLQAMTLLKCLCKKVMDFPETSELIFRSSIISATQYGISEVVEKILDSFPSDIIKTVDGDQRPILHLAVIYRHENVFNVLTDVTGKSFGFLSMSLDTNGNNILHLAGYRAQQYQLDLVSSTVLQMQRELKWFQQVERLVSPEQRKQKNAERMTPLEVFQKEHKYMEVYERQWMIGMANSCTVATTIIGTIAFAAAITVPGGNKGDGSPILSGRAAFIIFAISNALALFSSICTLLIFLSILTSRYATIDYLYSLPSRLIMGLVTLFFSVTSMIIAFSATLYLVFAQNNNRILIPIVKLALLPVTLFVILQFPLLLNMMQSTYGSSIFRPKKEIKPINIWELPTFIEELYFDNKDKFISCFYRLKDLLVGKPIARTTIFV